MEKEILKGLDSIVDNLDTIREKYYISKHNCIITKAFHKEALNKEQVENILEVLKKEKKFSFCTAILDLSETTSQQGKYCMFEYREVQFILVANNELVSIVYVEDLREKPVTISYGDVKVGVEKDKDNNVYATFKTDYKEMKEKIKGE